VADHLACIEVVAGDVADSVATVPSSYATSSRRQHGGPGTGDHPLDTLAAGIPDLNRLDPVSLVRTERHLGHLAPHADAFQVLDDVTGRRVLVVDDSWVTGARARSAAAALERAGAAVVAIVVAGRIVDTTAAPGTARWWRWVAQHAAADRRGSHGWCCLAGCRWRTRPPVCTA
jgi:hypothetical protein